MTDFFLRGLLHFWEFPAHVMVLSGVGLLLGQQGRFSIRAAWLGFMVAIVIGLAFGWMGLVKWDVSLILLIMAGMTGGLLALKLPLALWLCLLLAFVAGAVLGMDSVPVMIPGMRMQKLYATMAGTVIADSVFVLLLALLGLALRKLLDGIVLRVLGSWVAASALLVLTLMLAPR